MRESALTAYARVKPNSPSVDGDFPVFGDSDQNRDLMAFAGYPAIVSFDEASHIWKVPHQEYEHLTVHPPGQTPSPDINKEFKSMVRLASSPSSPFHSVSTTPDLAPNFVPPTHLQAPMSSWVPAEGIAPSFDSYGNMFDDGTLYRGAYIPAERDGDNRWNNFLLDAGVVSGSPHHDNFQWPEHICTD